LFIFPRHRRAPETLGGDAWRGETTAGTSFQRPEISRAERVSFGRINEERRRGGGGRKYFQQPEKNISV
jgi:hypothetical protein